MRVAYITPWGSRNSIASYAAELIPRINLPHHIFAEIDSNIDTVEEGVTRCWQRGEPLDDLVAQVFGYEPDVVYIEHQYGLFPDQAEWLRLLEQLASTNAKVFVKMHSVYKSPINLLFGYTEEPKYLKSIPHIIVHTPEAAKVLAARGLTNVSVIPHGINEPVCRQPPGKPYLFSFGHGAPYKGLETAIAVVRELKKTFPDVLYLGVFNTDSVPSQFYINKIFADIEAEGLQDNMIIFATYKPLATLKQFAQCCSVGLFTYNRYDTDSYGASGAARAAIGWGLPIVTSDCALFSDLEGVAKGTHAAEIADQVRKLLGSPEAAQAALVMQRGLAQRQSWDRVAADHMALFSDRVS